MYPRKVCLKSYVKLLDHLKSSVLHGKHTNYAKHKFSGKTSITWKWFKFLVSKNF